MTDRRRIQLSSWNHLGDQIVLGAAIRNLELSAHSGEFEVWHESPYQELFAGWPYVHIGNSGEPVQKVGYSGPRGCEYLASRGPMWNAYTLTLQDLLQVYIPVQTDVMPVFLTDDERARYEELAGCVIMNSNCQQCSMTKRYPYWNEVAKLLAPHRVVLIGSQEERNVFHDVKGANVIDLRRETTVRDLMALVHVCTGVVSPPSGIVHLAAAMKKPAVYITGAREPAGLIDYVNCRGIATTCDAEPERGHYHTGRGCGHMFSCSGQITIDGQLYPQCFACVKPETIAEAAEEVFFGD